MFPLHAFCGCIHQRTLERNAGPGTRLTDVANYKWAEDLKEKSKLGTALAAPKKLHARGVKEAEGKVGKNAQVNRKMMTL